MLTLKFHVSPLKNKHMKKIKLLCLVFFLTIGFAKADEGMWIPSLIQELNEKEMQDLGMNLSAEDIYSVNHSSLKDAIVKIPGCTAEIVSGQGLILTNHHCGYGRIQAHSTIDHDYLTDGFWAMNKSEELPNAGMYARILISIEDVTAKVLDGIAKDMPEGDFTMVFGYPGRTQEYLPSYGVEINTEVLNPIRIKLRAERLNIFKREIQKDKKVRIQYASKTARIANGWKKWQGESRGIRRFKTVDKKAKFEKEFVEWAKADESRNELYGSLISEFEKNYNELTPLQEANTYLQEAGYGIEIVKFADRFQSLLKEDPNKDEKAKAKQIKSLIASTEGFFKDYYQPIDEEVFVALLKRYHTEVAPHFLPEFFNLINTKYKGDYKKYADYIFKKSIFTSKEKVLKVLNNKKANYKAFEKDPVMKMAIALKQLENVKIKPSLNKINANIQKLQRTYMKAQMEIKPNHRFYPDANSTIRIHYGQVKAFVPMDAVSYKHFTTLEGIIEKENPDIYDYVVADRLKQLYDTKDYGIYAAKDGKIHVCFIAANHTSGGNSGSPILNADGHLLGLNFDRNWEGTMSDLSYDPSICRNISVDVRYVLFIIDKFAGAGHLVDEMTLVQ